MGNEAKGAKGKPDPALPLRSASHQKVAQFSVGVNMQDAGFALHLVNTCAVKQYDGLKHTGEPLLHAMNAQHGLQGKGGRPFLPSG